MTIIVFGNPDLPQDSLPLRLLPELQRLFADIEFRHLDPNEEWDDLPPDVTVIDTVVGLKEPRVFTDLNAFSPAPNLSLHDFDAYANLRLMLKLGRLKSVRVIGLPPETEPRSALRFVSSDIT